MTSRDPRGPGICGMLCHACMDRRPARGRQQHMYICLAIYGYVDIRIRARLDPRPRTRIARMRTDIDLRIRGCAHPDMHCARALQLQLGLIIKATWPRPRRAVRPLPRRRPPWHASMLAAGCWLRLRRRVTLPTRAYSRAHPSARWRAACQARCRPRPLRGSSLGRGRLSSSRRQCCAQTAPPTRLPLA